MVVTGDVPESSPQTRRRTLHGSLGVCGSSPSPAPPEDDPWAACFPPGEAGGRPCRCPCVVALCRPGSGASVPPAPSMWETVAKPRQLLYGHLWGNLGSALEGLSGCFPMRMEGTRGPSESGFSRVFPAHTLSMHSQASPGPRGHVFVASAPGARERGAV